MNIDKAIRNGVNWFLVTANSVVLFLSIQSLEQVTNNQKQVIEAFEMGAKALEQNASALEAGSKTLEEFGNYMADAVGAAASAFANFEDILDKHIELSRIECEVVLGEKGAVRDFAEICRINNYVMLKGIEKALEKLPDVKKYLDGLEVIYDGDEALYRKFFEDIESAGKRSRQQALKASVSQFKQDGVTLEVVSNHGATTFTREDFTFGNIPYSASKLLSTLCCLGFIADIAYENYVIDDQLHDDIEDILTPMLNQEADRLEGEYRDQGLKIVKKEKVFEQITV
jgi:hypothetical protein